MTHSLRAHRAVLMTALALGSMARAQDRDALLHIVQNQCLPHWRETQQPAPCERLAPDYAVLADRKGGAHFLLIPTQTLSGIEEPKLLQPATPNYFAAAWASRDVLNSVMGHALRREAVGLTINSALARGQDQLHIHIECLKPHLYQALQAAAASVSDHWAPLPFEDSPFLALRIRGQDLAAANPITLLANSVPAARQDMAAYTIIVAGARFKDGPGFIVLAGRTPTRAAVMLGERVPGEVAPGETLLDSSCAIDP
jgi:CDP-diacylglycerol pyrophosphatase